MLGSVDELGVLELVGAGAFDLLVHLLQPVHVRLGAKPKGAGMGQGEGHSVMAWKSSPYSPSSGVAGTFQ